MVHKTRTTKPIVDIIVLSQNNMRVTQKFILDLYKNTDVEFGVIWVDNGSCDKTPMLLKDIAENLPNFTLCLNQSNTGVIGGRNQGYEIYKSLPNQPDMVVIIDNDQFVKPGWLSHHISVLECGYDLVGVEARQMKDNFMPGIPNTNIGQHFAYVGCGGMIIRKHVLDEIGLFDMQFNPSYFEDPDFCYDKETKVMTSEGFKYFKDVTYADSVLTLNDDNIMEFNHPCNIIKKFEKNLLHFKNQQVDIMCSKEQKLLVGYKRTQWGDKDKGKFVDIDFISAEDINSKLIKRQCRHFIRKSGGKWIGQKNPYVCINGRYYDTKSFARFMGWYLSEGNVIYDAESRISRRDYTIDICQMEKSVYRSEIVDCITKISSKNINQYTDRISFCDKELSSYLMQFGKCGKKFVPQFIKDADIEIIECFLLSYIKGDGSFKKHNGAFSIFTSSHKMKEDLSEILVKTGKAFTVFEQLERDVKINNKIYRANKLWQIQSYPLKWWANLPPAKIVEYNDYVYDITVPNHRIFIQRNGKACWSSNCWRALDAGFKIGWNFTARIEHMPHQTLGPAKDKAERFIKSIMAFRKKWKGRTPPRLYQKWLDVFEK